MSAEPSALSAVVVDASVVVKWLLPEPASDVALDLRRQWHAKDAAPAAPDFLLIELHNVLWKKLEQGELTSEAPILSFLPLFGLDLNWFPSPRLLPLAWTFACRCHISIYDALYVALAHQLHAPFCTADTRLAQRVAGAVTVQPLVHA